MSMSIQDEVRVRELTEKSSVELRDYVVIEDNDGTKLTSIRSLKTVINNNTYFDTVEDMKRSTFNEGDICFTKGYHEKYDGGAARYCMVYDPYTADDGATTIHLDTSDNIRARLIYDAQSVNLQQFGAYGDSIHDDSKYIERAIATGKEVIFANDKTYRITNPIKVKSNQKINFNWCKLYPINCIAISVQDKVHNVSLENINIDCMNNSTGISIEGSASNIQIDGFHITNLNIIYSGIKLNNCMNIKISNGYIEGLSLSGTGVTVESVTDNNLYYHIQNILFENIRMKKLDKYVYTHNQNKASNMTFSNCSFEGDLGDSNFRYGYYLSGAIDGFEIKDQVSSNIKNFLYVSSAASGNVIVDDLSVFNSNIIFDQSSTTVTLTLKGIHTYDASISNLTVLSKLLGKLYIDESAIFEVDYTRYKNTGSTQLQGKLYDMKINTELIDMNTIIPDNTVAVLNVSTFRNSYYDWKATNDIDSISGGIEGQVLYIVSTTGKRISTKNNIILFASALTLSSTIGVKLQLINGKWTQI